jgi:hypothetical protein
VRSRSILEKLCAALFLFAPPAVNAAENPMDCVQEIAMPYVTGGMMMSVPATIQVHVLIGEHGMAQRIDYGDAKPILGLELDEYFKKKTRYVEACKGKTISFTIRYIVEGNRTTRPVSEVRFRPPNEFIVLCHPVEPALDPLREPKPK